MSGMQVDPNILQVALAKAITDAVPAEMQKEIFAKALHEHLFHTPRNSDKSPVSDAFQRALNDATRKLADEVVADPENKQRIRLALQDAFNKTLEEGTFVNSIMKRIVNCLPY